MKEISFFLLPTIHCFIVYLCFTYHELLCDPGAFLAEPELHACADQPHGPQLQLHQEQQRWEHDDDVHGPGHPAEQTGPRLPAESGPGQTIPG